MLSRLAANSIYSLSTIFKGGGSSLAAQSGVSPCIKKPYSSSSNPQAGISPFVLQVYKMEFNYCSHARDSRGLIQYLKDHLIAFATQHPSIEFLIRPKFSRRPLVSAFYLNDKKRTICLKNMDPELIHEKILLLRNSDGEKAKRFHEKVVSTSPAVRNIWDPWHGTKLSPFDGSEKAWISQMRRQKALRGFQRNQAIKQSFEQYSLKGSA